MIKSTVPHKKFNFPVGETHVTAEVTDFTGLADINWEYENDSEIIELLLLANSLHGLGIKVRRLNIPYVPFSRQDRVANAGEPLSIKVICDLINSIGAESVRITDPHSDVTTALLNNVQVIPQQDVFHLYLPRTTYYYLVSPDAGALKKIYKSKARGGDLCHGVIECNKQRNTVTGEITGINVPVAYLSPGASFIIMDDICDGGGTFVAIAKELKKTQPASVTLMVTHGFFTKGLSVFDGLIDHIYTRKGKIK